MTDESVKIICDILIKCSIDANFLDKKAITNYYNN